MKNSNYRRVAFIAVLVLTGYVCNAQLASSKEVSNPTKSTPMKTFVIVRDIPGAGKLTDEELKGIAQTSCSVLKEMGPKIEWLHSYVTGNQIYCIYKAENEDLIKEHARKGGFPANSIIEVSSVISPATAGKL